ncbi:MAG: hypothetical protein ACTSP4_00845 [Candidatus Hodarchaeales archaeon]
MGVKDVYGMIPINKQASMITSQKGCSNNIFVSLKEKREILGQKDQILSLQIRDLKHKIGIKKNHTKKSFVPQIILNHPKYRYLLNLNEKSGNLKNEIREINEELKKIKIENYVFEVAFINTIRNEYPEIFKEIKDKVFEVLNKGYGDK